MRLLSLYVAAGVLVAAGGSAASAQSPASVTDRMPFATPYGSSLTLSQARELADAAEAEAQKRGWKDAIAVVDPAGDLVFLEKMDGTMAAAAAIAQNKARTAARFRRSTTVFFHAFETGHPYVATLDHGVVASPGGLPLIENGKIIGAIGCSGGTGGQDEVVCKAAADKVR
ncbi:MAG: GlcG/HbpS family heme-binding protein [Methylovirgula sp.]